MVRVRALLLAGLLLSGPALAADVYRSVGPNGEVVYTDEPPSKGAKPVQLPPIQVVEPYVSPAAPVTVPSINGVPAEPAPAASAAASPLSATIVSPTAKQRVRSADGRLPVTVSLGQLLPEGYGLRYLLDGSAQSDTPTRNLNFTLEKVGPGEHVISVVTVDARGNEVGRAAPVIVQVDAAAAAKSP